MEYQEIISNIKEIGSYIGSYGIGIIAYNFDCITKFISLLCEVGSLEKAWQIYRKNVKKEEIISPLKMTILLEKQ